MRPRITAPFESFANSKRYKTPTPPGGCAASLRALLIQKDTKRAPEAKNTEVGLRALLIQKDTKRKSEQRWIIWSLRALPIQKDTKHVKSEVKRMIV